MLLPTHHSLAALLTLPVKLARLWHCEVEVDGVPLFHNVAQRRHHKLLVLPCQHFAPIRVVTQRSFNSKPDVFLVLRTFSIMSLHACVMQLLFACYPDAKNINTVAAAGCFCEQETTLGLQLLTSRLQGLQPQLLQISLLLQQATAFVWLQTLQSYTAAHCTLLQQTSAFGCMRLQKAELLGSTLL